MERWKDGKMERLTIPDKKIPGGVRKTIIDTRAVREEAMTLYWALKKYKDTGLTPNEVEQLKENQRWIPVEKGLPKRNGVYNITGYVGGNYMRDSAYFDGQDTWHNDNRVNHSRCYLTDVIAWMPLPRPYQEEEN